MGQTKEFAGTILITPEQQFILQLRDDKPGIADPGKLSIFAGRIEPGEDVATAAERELSEETNLTLKGLERYRSFTKDPARHGGEGICHVFVAHDINPENLTVYEGQGYRVVEFSDLNEENTALISYDILQQYAADNSL